ncbi:MAG: VWA domain-containing protein [Gammaproteobacteria bacterium]|nr:VWA domain-containing protein [Gammaproteobacteria bacterium]
MSLLGRSLRGAWQRLAGTLLLACILAPGVALAAADVRILIDVSGSMKENDPANLRVPAMRLMSELLPAGTVAGVWLFAEDATPLIAPAPVDEAWRQRARAELPKIHARGLFTDIERALAAATADWQGPPGERERHVLLLTDGVVDVSKVPQESAASRERILSAQLAQLTASGAHVHAVALSDKVDRELIEALTAGTGGWLERADDAARLQRIFLHMLEQTAPPVTVPLEGNRFDIDKSVSELTLLVFREGDVPVTLTPPGATTAWTADSAPAPVQWRHEAGYDLVTVAQPPPGNWQFTGTSDPDNRAVVVTNLALELARLPASLLASESARLDARMVSGGQHVTRLELLELVAAGYTLAAADGTSTPGQLALDGERAVFSGELGATADAVLAPGVYQVTVTADAGSFKRQAVTRMRIVADPVSVAYSVDPASQAAVEVAVTADASLTRPDTLEGYVSVTDAANLVRVLPLPVASEDGIARVSVAASSAGRHEVAVHAFVTTPGGALRVAPPAQVFELAWTPPVAEPEARAEPEPPPPSGVAWGRFAAYVGGGNAVLALGLGLAWFVFGRTRKPAEAAA